MPGHDVIAIGASAGGVEALRSVVSDLPGDLPASLFVVLHVPSDGTSMLPAILSRAGSLPAIHPQDGAPVEHGYIYVAPPGQHLMVEQDHIKLARGPKENRHRPAIDPLFRSVALYYGPRAVGVVLTGMLDDGTSGLTSIKECHGVAVVQDPEDAMYPAMPRSALQHVDVDYVLPLSDIPARLVHLAHEKVSNERSYSAPKQLEIESKIATMEGNNMENVAKIAKPSVIGCPECHGALWEMHDGELIRFRCQVGHAYTIDSLLADHSEAVERVLWASLRALEERAELTHRLAKRARDQNQMRAAVRFDASVQETEEHVHLVRQILATNSGEQFSEEG